MGKVATLMVKRRSAEMDLVHFIQTCFVPGEEWTVDDLGKITNLESYKVEAILKKFRGKEISGIILFRKLVENRSSKWHYRVKNGP